MISPVKIKATSSFLVYFTMWPICIMNGRVETPFFRWASITGRVRPSVCPSRKHLMIHAARYWPPRPCFLPRGFNNQMILITHSHLNIDFLKIAKWFHDLRDFLHRRPFLQVADEQTNGSDFRVYGLLVIVIDTAWRPDRNLIVKKCMTFNYRRYRYFENILLQIPLLPIPVDFASPFGPWTSKKTFLPGVNSIPLTALMASLTDLSSLNCDGWVNDNSIIIMPLSIYSRFSKRW